MFRVRAVGTGWDGGPGLTTFYFSELEATNAGMQALVDRVRQYFVQMAAHSTNTIAWTVQTEVAQIDPATGDQTGAFVAPVAPGVIVGIGGTVQMPPNNMLLLRLVTAKFVRGRRVQGHSNYGPLSNNATDAAGTPTAGAIGLLTQAGTDLVADGAPSADLLVWSRPNVLKGFAGTTATVIGVTVPDKFAVLRSRRD